MGGGLFCPSCTVYIGTHQDPRRLEAIATNFGCSRDLGTLLVVVDAFLIRLRSFFAAIPCELSDRTERNLGRWLVIAS